MSDTISEPDEVIYMVGLDGTGSMHPCSKEDDGAVTYIRADHIDAQDAKIKGLVGALENAKQELEDVTEEFMGEDYNSPSLNAALAAAKEPT